MEIERFKDANNEQINSAIKRYDEEIQKIKDAYTNQLRGYDSSVAGIKGLIIKNREYLEKLRGVEAKYEEAIRDFNQAKEEFNIELKDKLGELRNLLEERMKSYDKLLRKEVNERIILMDDSYKELKGSVDGFEETSLAANTRTNARIDLLDKKIDEKVATILQEKIEAVKRDLFAEIEKMTISGENLRHLNNGLQKLSELEKIVGDLNLDQIFSRIRDIEAELGPLSEKVQKIMDLLISFVKFDLSNKIYIKE